MLTQENTADWTTATTLRTEANVREVAISCLVPDTIGHKTISRGVKTPIFNAGTSIFNAGDYIATMRTRQERTD